MLLTNLQIYRKFLMELYTIGVYGCTLRTLCIKVLNDFVFARHLHVFRSCARYHRKNCRQQQRLVLDAGGIKQKVAGWGTTLVAQTVISRIGQIGPAASAPAAAGNREQRVLPAWLLSDPPVLPEGRGFVAIGFIASPAFFFIKHVIQIYEVRSSYVSNVSTKVSYEPKKCPSH